MRVRDVLARKFEKLVVEKAVCQKVVCQKVSYYKSSILHRIRTTCAELSLICDYLEEIDDLLSTHINNRLT